jgi:hypothetical protein
MKPAYQGYEILFVWFADIDKFVHSRHDVACQRLHCVAKRV